jgi:hypothetical protein
MFKKGFTLIELLVFVAIFALIIGSFVTILVAVISLQSNQSAIAEVSEQSQFFIQQIQYYVSGARLADMPLDSATNKIVLREPASASIIDPTVIYVGGGVAYLQQGATSAQAFTSSAVSISNFSVTRHYNINSSSSAFGVESVSYSFTMSSASAPNGTSYSQSFQGSVALFSPVPKIAMVQQAKAESALPNVSSLSATFPSNNESGDMLIAVVANTASGATVTLSDSAGNSWNTKANATYPSYNTEISVLNAQNIINSSNTVTATFGGPTAGFASMFIYEYRGASTSSSFDVSANQTQSSNSSPSSGFANATSATELVLGVIHNANTAEIPSGGAGFTLETTSTVSNAFFEDMNQFITGPTSANWQFSGTPDSSVVVATFK